MTFKDLEPSPLWAYFEDICRIPRLSKKETKIIDYILGFARTNKLDFDKDDTGNILIRKSASPGFEHLKTVVLQSHMDMVGEKDQDVEHDFEKDPIRLVREKDWITARGTTLGADDGIGIAAQLVLLTEGNIEHGPLECLFTVDEESGMTGAKNIDPGLLKGKILLNLDSEDEGELFIGCAGGIDTIATFSCNRKKIDKNYQYYQIRISGLNGGHSGDEIHKSPANAIKILNRFLWNASREFNVRLGSIDGGNLRNAIPREASASIAVPAKYIADFESFYHVYRTTLRKELKLYEPGMVVELLLAEALDHVINKKSQIRLLNALYACPHGVITWSNELKGLVETSTNLASVKMAEEKTIKITTSQRSSVDSAKKDIADRIGCVFRMAGAKIEHSDGYPGWTPDTNSDILRISTASYKRLFRKNPAVRAIHAGLECGLILEKYPGLDMISFGPTIKGAHTPGERINIRSTVKFWNLLLDILKNIPIEETDKPSDQ